MATRSSTALLTSLIILLSVFSCHREETADQLLEAGILRSENGRIIVSGRATLPDGTWLYIETVADPDGLNGVTAEAFPVESGVFTAVTPFTAPLKYRAEIVVSPALNPGLADYLSALPEKPGSIMRRSQGSAEITFRSEATFGNEADKTSFCNEITDQAAKYHRDLSKDFEHMTSEAWLAKAPDLLRRYNADIPSRLHIYAPTLADLLAKTRKELDSLYKLHIKSLSESVDAKTMEKRRKAIQRRLKKTGDAIQTMRTKCAN